MDSSHDLKQSVEGLHNCCATFSEVVAVTQQFGDQLVWNGAVHVFRISGHPDATTCYAWSSAVEGSNKRRFHAVLEIPPVDTPQTAVRAAIVADHKAGRSL